MFSLFLSKIVSALSAVHCYVYREKEERRQKKQLSAPELSAVKSVCMRKTGLPCFVWFYSGPLWGGGGGALLFCGGHKFSFVHLVHIKHDFFFFCGLWGCPGASGIRGVVPLRPGLGSVTLIRPKKKTIMLPSPDQNLKIGSVGRDFFFFFFFFLRTVRELSFPIFFLKFLNGENLGRNAVKTHIQVMQVLF